MADDGRDVDPFNDVDQFLLGDLSSLVPDELELIEVDCWRIAAGDRTRGDQADQKDRAAANELLASCAKLRSALAKGQIQHAILCGINLGVDLATSAAWKRRQLTSRPGGMKKAELFAKDKRHPRDQRIRLLVKTIPRQR